MNLLEQLNPSQREAVEYIDGPSQVIAGAGSGKTRVLTYKIAYLIEQGLAPWNILALTFTNKAANEMKERITKLVGEKARALQMGTFHSIFSRILRAEAQHIPCSLPNNGRAGEGLYTSQFTIYDETDSRSLLKAIIKEQGLDDKIYKPSTVHNRISMAKNNIELPADYRNCSTYQKRDSESRMDKMPLIYEIYQTRLRQSNAMDFDDLLLYTYLLFGEHEEIRQKYAQRFKYVLVDEYQDTNSVQQMIVLQIVREHQHICVVGDDAQSIYGFRGANIDNILDFQQKFSNSATPAKLFKLEQNYRSTQTIVEAANSLIRHNNRQIPKKVFSKNAQGEKLQLKYVYSDREEAIVVCKDIKQIMKSEGMDYADFAILYRTNAQSRTFEEQMRKDNIPYRIIGGLSFYQRKEIKDVIAYLRLVLNPHDEEALRRIINYPARGIGNTTVEKVMAHAARLGVSPWEVISQCSPFTQTIALEPLNVNKGTATKLGAFAEKIAGYAARIETDDVYTLGKAIIEETGISKEIYSGHDADDISRQENLEELLASMQDFVELRREEDDQNVFLADYLQEVSLMSDLDSDEVSQSKVVLMTVHSAKGLEFPTVFIVGMEDQLFPSPMSCDSLRQLEEERRLLYVAITRAEKHCILTSAQNRYRYGRLEFDTPSRFLYDIDPSLVKVHSKSGADDDDDDDFFARRRKTQRQNTFAQRSNRYGNPSMQNSRPVASQFLADPKPKVTEPRQQPVISRTTGRRLVPISAMINSSTSPSGGSANANGTAGANGRVGTLLPGTVIEHDRFGLGTVKEINGVGDNAKATVEFRNSGTKVLLLKFSKFTVKG